MSTWAVPNIFSLCLNETLRYSVSNFDRIDLAFGRQVVATV
jgi:hypothetical protein